MAKRSWRHPEQCEKEKSGCMPGLIRIFDFLQSHPTQKLISDRKHRKRHAVGTRNSSGLNLETNFDKKCKGIDVDQGSQTLPVDVDLLSTQHQKNQITSSEEQIPSILERGGNIQKAHKQTKNIHKTTCDMQVHDLKDAASLESQWTPDPNLMKQSPNYLDLSAVIEEFCSQIRQYQEIHLYYNDRSEVQVDIGCPKHDRIDELSVQLIRKQSALQAILSEATQFFISGKDLTQDGAIHQPKQFIDASDILNSSKELFLKLLQDSNSLLLKHIQDLQDAETRKDGPTKLLAAPNLANTQIFNSGQLEKLICSKRFWKKNSRIFSHRRIKSQNRYSSQGHGDSQTSSITVLKPVKASIHISESGTSLYSLPPSHDDFRNDKIVRTATRFSFREIKKRTIKHSLSFKRRDKMGHPKDSEPNNGHGGDSKSSDGCLLTTMKTIAHAKPRESSIYIEAKKHLSEILSMGDENEDLSSRRVLKALERILSVCEYILSPIDSQGKERDPCFTNAQNDFSSDNNFQISNKGMLWLKKEGNASLVSPLSRNLEALPCTDDDKPGKELQALNSNSDSTKELHIDIEIHGEGACSEPKTSPTGGVKALETTDLPWPEEVSILDISLEPNSTAMTYAQQTTNTAKFSESIRYTDCPGMHLPEENENPLSLLDTVPPNFMIHEVEDLSNNKDRTEQSSPVSVLEPFFTNDISSPPSPLPQAAEPPMQPLQIHFEAHDSFVETHSNSETYLRTCMVDYNSAFEYVRAVLHTSGLSWDDILEKWQSSDQLLDLSLFDKVEVSLSNQFSRDQRLLFDCVNEVLVDVCKHHFGCSPWVSFVKPKIQLIPIEKNVAIEVWKGIDWQLAPQLPSHTLDQIVGEDMVKAGTWMNLQFDAEDIGFEMGEVILEELMEDTIFELCTLCSETIPSSTSQRRN